MSLFFHCFSFLPPPPAELWCISYELMDMIMLCRRQGQSGKERYTQGKEEESSRIDPAGGEGLPKHEEWPLSRNLNAGSS